MKPALRIGIVVAALCVVAMLVWQGVTAHGAPDPTRPDTSPTVAFLDIGVLVFREGLECILVLAAITASMTGAKRAHRRPIAFGAGLAFAATLVTWLIAVRIVGSLSDNMSALDLQAATGLLAVIVLLVIMNWFFHKIYWGGWIRAHNRRRKSLVENARAVGISQRHLWWGLILLGFTSLYREGFEVVLFLQAYYLRLGGGVVLKGALLGFVLTGWWRAASKRRASHGSTGRSQGRNCGKSGERCTGRLACCVSEQSSRCSRNRPTRSRRIGGTRLRARPVGQSCETQTATFYLGP